jgi:hypothetical protein
MLIYFLSKKIVYLLHEEAKQATAAEAVRQKRKAQKAL